MRLPGDGSFKIIAVGVPLLVAIVLCEAPPASADVTYVEALKVKGADGSTAIKRTVNLSGPQEREDAVMSLSPSDARQAGTRHQETNTITNIDHGLSWTLDPESKTYSQVSLNALQTEMKQKALLADSTALTAEAPDASPRVTITPTSDVKLVGPWKATKTTVEVSTVVIDLPSGVRRNGTIVWDLWLADSIPGAAEMRAFNRLRAQKLGTPSEIEPLEAFGKSFTKSVKQAMLALREVHGYPVAWTWVVRTALSPEERSALEESAATQRESIDEPAASDDQSEQPNDEGINQLRDIEQHTVRSNANKDLHRPGEGAPAGEVEAPSADMNADAGEGSMVLMRIESTLKSVTTTRCDPALFQIPSGYRILNR